MPDKPPVSVADLLEANAALRCEVVNLGEKVEGLADSTEHLAASDARQRHGLIALTVGGLLLALVVGVVAYALVRIDENDERLDQQKRYDVASCERGNATRAAQRKQWADVRGLLIRLGAGPDTRKLADALVVNANRNFPPLDCSVLVHGQEPQPVTSTTPPPR